MRAVDAWFTRTWEGDRVNKRTRFPTTLIVTISLLAACGGGSDSNADDAVATSAVATTPPTDPPVTEPVATDPPATNTPVSDPPVTDPPESSLPDWASGEMVTVESDTGPLELPVEFAPFCEVSRSFYVAANALEDVGGEQVGTARQLFGALGALAPLTIEAAPSDELAEKPTAARDHLTVIIPALEQIGYDATRIGELADAQAFSDAIEGLGGIRDDVRKFLIEACGADGDVLDSQSQNAIAVAAEAAGESSEPDGPVDAVAGTEVTNEAFTISVSVPTDWTEVEESVESGRDQMVASSDIDTFYGLATPGVLVLRGEGGLRDGGFVGRLLDYQSDLEEIQCVVVEEADYDDGFYSGQEKLFDCGTDGLDVRLLGGTTSDESLYTMLLLIHPTDEPGVRQLIVDTFEVA